MGNLDRRPRGLKPPRYLRDSMPSPDESRAKAAAAGNVAASCCATGRLRSANGISGARLPRSRRSSVARAWRYRSSSAAPYACDTVGRLTCARAGDTPRFRTQPPCQRRTQEPSVLSASLRSVQSAVA